MRRAKTENDIPEQAATNSWRRRLRFSVRTMIVLVLLIGLWLGWRVHSARVQQDAVAAILHAGGLACYDYQRRGGMSFDPLAEPPEPRWLLDRIGVDYLHHPVYVSFPTQEPDDAIMVSIGQLRRLERLELSGTKLTENGLAHLEGLHDLELLYLGSATDAGSSHLKGLTSLRDLSLFRTQISDAGIVNLRGLTRLKTLNLAGTRAGDGALRHLHTLSGLERLSLRETTISDEGLMYARNLTNLKQLDLDRTKITDTGLTHLRGLTRLETLRLGGRAITDAGLAHLKDLHGLKRLDLFHTSVTDAGARELQRTLPNLKIHH